MFQEAIHKQNMDDQLLQKFPNLLRSNNSISRFTNATDEFNVLRNGVGLRILFDAVIVKLTGKDVLDFLHRISTNSLLNLQPQQQRNTLFLNEKGRFIDRATLLSLDNEYRLIGSPDQHKRLFNWINKFVIMEDIGSEDLSDKLTMLEFIGPQTDSFLTLMLGSEVDLNDVRKVQTLGVDGFQFLFFVNRELNGLKISKIVIEKEKAMEFINYMFGIKSVFDLMLIGNDAFDALRIQNGIPSLPQEINDLTNPYEINLIDEVNFKKGCYIGQEVIARLDTYNKVQRALVRATFSSTPIEKNAVIFCNDSVQAGVVTSLSSPELFDSQIGLALMNKKIVNDQKRFYVLKGDEKIPVEILLLDNSK